MQGENANNVVPGGPIPCPEPSKPVPPPPKGQRGVMKFFFFFGKRSKFWIGTLQDPEETFEWKEDRFPDLEYACFQLEAGKNQRLHWQFYLVFTRQKSGRQVSKIFDPRKPHLQTRKGTHLQAKVGTFEFFLFLSGGKVGLGSVASKFGRGPPQAALLEHQIRLRIFFFF